MAWGDDARLCKHCLCVDSGLFSDALVCVSTGRETMNTLAWFKRRKAEGEEIFELEEFLRSVALIHGEHKASGGLGDRPQPARPAVPSEPPRRELDERLDEALLETFPASDPIAVSTAS